MDAPYGGLTCATFVLLIAESQGVKFINFEKWKKRASDKVWQRQILQSIEKYIQKKGLKADLAFIETQKKAVGKVSRFKPEEVAAAAGIENPPHDFEAINGLASQLLNKISFNWGNKARDDSNSN